MSFMNPITKMHMISAKPITLARSMVRSGTGSPRTFSTRLQKT